MKATTVALLVTALVPSALANLGHNARGLASPHHVFTPPDFLTHLPASEYLDESSLIAQTDAIAQGFCGTGPDDVNCDENSPGGGLVLGTRGVSERNLIVVGNPKIKVQKGPIFQQILAGGNQMVANAIAPIINYFGGINIGSLGIAGIRIIYDASNAPIGVDVDMQPAVALPAVVPSMGLPPVVMGPSVISAVVPAVAPKTLALPTLVLPTVALSLDLPTLALPTLALPTIALPLPTLPAVEVTVVVTTSSTTTTTPTKTSEAASTTSKAAATPPVLYLPPPPSGNCVGQYKDTSSGAVYGPGLGDFPMSPRPSSFVTRSGSSLYLDGKPFRIAGPNIYWLGLDENVVPNPSYPSHGRVREAMAITVAMGANTIRSHTLGVSTGNSLSIWPKNGQTNNAAFEPIDYAIWAARNYGLRLIVPLTDDYAYYHGGKFDFIGWAGLSKNDAGAFYTSDAVITIFKAYISVVLNHVNQYTGVAYKDDPTIMAWETGNELGAYFLSGGAPPAAWTNNIASYIKSIAPQHLVADGSDGLVDTSGILQNTGVNVGPVDLVTDHFYPAEDWLLTKDIGIMAGFSKNYFVGELDWTGQKGGDSLPSFYSLLESMPGSGSMIWSVFGHDDQCCNYVVHGDGYSLEYPNGNNGALQAQILLLIQHWSRLTGKSPPNSMPAVACPQPELEY